MANLVDTGVNGDLRVTGNIYGNLSGNATTATTWAAGREFKIQDADATNTGATVTGVNGSGNVTLKLPSTIKGTLTGNATTCTYPYGFAKRNTSNKWGTLSDSTYTWVTDWGTSDGSEIAFGSKSGQLSAQIDGYFYQREGTYRVLDSSDGMTCGICGTAAGTAAKVASAMNYTASVGNTILVRFANTNSAAGALTLNLGGQTKTIKWNGTVTASGTTSAIPAGTWPCYYDGTYWNIWTNGATEGRFIGSLGPRGFIYAPIGIKNWAYLGQFQRMGLGGGTWGTCNLIVAVNAGITSAGNKYDVDTYFISFMASAQDFSGKAVLLNSTSKAANTYTSFYVNYTSNGDWALYAYHNTDKGYGNYKIYELSGEIVQSFRFDTTGMGYLDSEPSSKTAITGYISALFPSSITDNQVVLTSGTNGVLKTAAIGTSSGQIAAGNHTHSNATTSAAGFMSASDYQRLNGSQNIGEHDANNCTTTGFYYGSSNMPPTDLGASTTDDALYVEAWSTSWVAQIAQDYRNGNLFVRSKNNGTWQSWRRIPYLTVKNRGGTTTPVYVDTNGEIQSCTAYAGGTAVTLNNSSKAGSTATFYAPTAGGTANYVLIGNGATAAPTWAEKAPNATAADTATSVSYPAGFNSRQTSWTWGTLTTANGYTQVTDWHTSSGSDISFAEKSGAVSVQIDGKFYQNDGKNKVLDAADVSVPSPVPTLEWNTEKTLATIDGKNIKVKLPASPDTDTKVTQTGDDASTGTGFELLFSATGDHTNRTETSRKSSKLTYQPSSGTLKSTAYNVNSKCTLQFNTTTNALDFVFA